MSSNLDVGIAVGGRVLPEAEVAVLDEARGVALRSHSHLAQRWWCNTELRKSLWT